MGTRVSAQGSSDGNLHPRRSWVHPSWMFVILLLVGVVALNARFFADHPLPRNTQHDTFIQTTSLLHQLQGFTARDHYYALPHRALSWDGLVAEFQQDGRFGNLAGRCDAHFWSCAPHGQLPSAALAALLPGHPTLASLGVTAYFLLLLLAQARCC